MNPSARLSLWLWLAPAFGVAVASCFAASWLALERAFTVRTLAAAIFIAVAGSISAGLALLADRLVASWPWTARFAAALLMLTAGPVALTSLMLAVDIAWRHHPMNELQLRFILLIIAFTGVATLYNFLAVAGFLLLPLGFPVIVVFALALARRR